MLHCRLISHNLLEASVDELKATNHQSSIIHCRQPPSPAAYATFATVQGTKATTPALTKIPEGTSLGGLLRARTTDTGSCERWDPPSGMYLI